jgi:acetoin utilization deacetylase AcuC-like enzyme
MRLGIAYDPEFLKHRTGEGHAERPARLQSIMARLEETGWLGRLRRVPFVPAAYDAIEAVHPRSYVLAIKDACEKAGSGLVYLDEDTPVCADSFEVARAAAGAVIGACDAVIRDEIDRAFCAVRPPGHHAETARAMGFCLFNNVAIAARHLQRLHGIRRVLIVDWDVHHGNGTQEIFYEDPSVFYFSTHQAPLYPGTGFAEERGAGPGEGTTLNCPLPEGAGDEELIRVFNEKLVPAAHEFRPEFILISAGFDPHAADPLAGLRVTEQGFARLTEIVAGIAREHCQGRVVSALEGGYDLSALAGSVAAHLAALTSDGKPGAPA